MTQTSDISPESYSSYLSEGHVAIFLFHGVVDQESEGAVNYTKKHISKDFFLKTLQALKSVGSPLTIDEMVRHYQTGKEFSGKPFVITFDDGFENNYTLAAPILKNLKIPCIFYITSAFVDMNMASWIDSIEYSIQNSSRTSIVLPWENNLSSLVNTDDKIKVLKEIRRYAKSTPEVDRDKLVTEISKLCGLKEQRKLGGQFNQKLSWRQLQELSDCDLFTIGGHTHTHSILSFCDADKLEYEISHNIQMLESNLNIKIKHFAYPDGEKHHYNQKVIECLKGSGIISCPTAVSGLNAMQKLNDELFHLKRIMVIQ